MPIPDDDKIYRHCIAPISFGSKRSPLPEKFFHLVETSETTLQTSVAWAKFLPNDDDVRGYGCRLAAGMNLRAKAAVDAKPNSRKVYCGAYHLKASAVRALAGSPFLYVKASDVVHREENGEEAHTDLTISLVVDESISAQGTKTAIVVQLWNSSCGPARHQCDCDKAIDSHPSHALEISPCGKSQSDDGVIVGNGDGIAAP